MLNLLKYVPLIILSIVYSCADNSTTFNNNDLLFPNSLRLKVPSYTFSDSMGNSFEVHGDTSYFTGIQDTLNKMPLFKWDSLGLKIITLAVFSSKPVVLNGKINNIGNIIWQWHSGMEFGREGMVQYSEGKSVFNDTIDYNQIVLPLENGNYFWAVWAWTNDGTEILFSSRIMSFYVK
jgi:hypothetical protein